MDSAALTPPGLLQVFAHFKNWGEEMRSKKFCNLKFYAIATALCAVQAVPIANAEYSTLGGQISHIDLGS
jgi:hypothetical protein